jgi:hypothetical protein
MTDRTKSHLDDQIDRYARGELSASEARQLAQSSLEDEELFEELTSTTLAKAALADSTLGDKKVLRFPQKIRGGCRGRRSRRGCCAGVVLFPELEAGTAAGRTEAGARESRSSLS